MMAKQMAPIFQLFSMYPINKLIGIASTKAVNAESWRGEIFLVENIVRRYKVEGTRIKDQNTKYKEQEIQVIRRNFKTLGHLCLVSCTLCLSSFITQIYIQLPSLL